MTHFTNWSMDLSWRHFHCFVLNKLSLTWPCLPCVVTLHRRCSTWLGFAPIVPRIVILTLFFGNDTLIPKSTRDLSELRFCLSQWSWILPAFLWFSEGSLTCFFFEVRMKREGRWASLKALGNHTGCNVDSLCWEEGRLRAETGTAFCCATSTSDWTVV